MTHCPSRRVDRRLALTGRVEPGAMRTGDLAAKVGDGGDQGWPSLGRRIGIGAVIATWMETQRAYSMQGWNAAAAQIRFRDRAGNRLRHRKQAAGGFGRSTRGR